jgi:hypothetical protein
MDFEKMEYHSKAFLEKHGIMKEGDKFYIFIKFGNYRKHKVELAKDKDKALQELYDDRGISRNGRDTFYNKVREHYGNISREKTFDFLKKQPNYQMHLIQPREKSVKPVAYDKINRLWQIDLVDMKKFKYPMNRNKAWILTVIDVFSKFAWAVALPNKGGFTIQQALDKILNIGYDMTSNYPKLIQSDNGGEFVNGYMNHLLEVFGITHVKTQSYLPQAQGIIERFNKTLKGLIFSNMSQNNNKLYVDDLAMLVNNYNNSYHSTIRDKPINIHKEKRKSVKQVKILQKIKDDWMKTNFSYPEIKIGDRVRVHILTRKTDRKKKTFAKKYLAQWSKEIYTVNYIIGVGSTKVKQTYQLINDYGKLLHRTYYRHDLKVIPD